MADAEDLAALPNLGKVSAQWLLEADIRDFEQLRQLGAVRAWLQVKHNSSTRPSLNLLYALQGAIDNCHWQQVQKQQRQRLLLELEALEETLKF